MAGEIDRTRTAADGIGGTAQLTSKRQIFGLDSVFVLGDSVDHGAVQFDASSELAGISAQFFPLVNGLGQFIDLPSGDKGSKRPWL